MPDTAIERDFAGGRFRFWLSLPQVVSVQRGPANSRLHSRTYPVSIFQLYDELSAGIAIDLDGNPVLLPGMVIYPEDVRNIIEQGLRGGNSGTRDGEPFDVGPQLAARLVEENTFPERPLEEAAFLAWSILHAAIKGIDLKKKAQEEQVESHNSSEKDS